MVTSPNCRCSGCSYALAAGALFAYELSPQERCLQAKMQCGTVLQGTAPALFYAVQMYLEPVNCTRAALWPPL